MQQGFPWDNDRDDVDRGLLMWLIKLVLLNVQGDIPFVMLFLGEVGGHTSYEVASINPAKVHGLKCDIFIAFCAQHLHMYSDSPVKCE